MITLSVKPNICLIDKKALDQRELSWIKSALVIVDAHYINGRREIRKRVNLLKEELGNYLSFPTSYLHRFDQKLTKLADKEGVDLTIEADFSDHHANFLDKHPFPNHKFEEPRQWQQDALDCLDELDEDGEEIHEGIFSAMTGEGKSYLIARLIEKYKKTTLVIVPTTSIQNGLVTKLERYFGKSMVTKNPPKGDTGGVTLKEALEFKNRTKEEKRDDDSVKSLSAQILEAKGITKKYGRYKKTQDADKSVIRGEKDKSDKMPAVAVVCFASLENLSMEYLESVGCVIIDEAHWSACDSILNALREMCNAFYKFALSATLFKDSQAQMELLCAAVGNRLIYEILPTESIKRGTVQYPIYHQYDTPGCVVDGKDVYLQDFRTDSNGNRLSKWKEKNPHIYRSIGIIANEARNEFILEKCFELLAEGRRVFLALSEEAHSFYFEERLKEINSPDFDVYVIHGGVSKKERQKREQMASEGVRPALVIGTMAIGEGSDIANITDVFLVDTQKSPIRLFQRIGRGVRTNDFSNKFTFQVHDMKDWFHDKLREHSYLRKKLFFDYYERNKDISFVEEQWNKIGGLRKAS